MFINNRYTLMNKNNVIIDFECERGNDSSLVIKEIKTYDSPLPYGFRNIESWVANRRAPRHRKHIAELLELCGCNDLEGFIKFTYCASLNDTFWVKPYNTLLRWDDVSLYRNDFDENIARIAFDGGLMGEQFSSTSPELVTDGSFAKCWKRFDDTICLLKQGSSGAVNAGKEPFSELYAYNLAKNICDNPVEYDIVKHHGRLSARCPLFTSENISYAPIVYYLGSDITLKDIMKFYDSNGSLENFCQMMVLDALTLNPDRHLKNYGFLYKSESMEIIGMSPIFDNNLSLFPYLSDEELSVPDKCLSRYSSALNDGFNEIALKCMSPRLKSTLINLHGFKFNRDYKYHLSDNRLTALEKIVNLQIDNLLKRKIITITEKKTEPIRLDSLLITIKIDEIASDETLSLLKEEMFTISSFDLIMSDGAVLNIESCEYSAFKEGLYLQIDVFNSRIKGESKTLDVIDIRNLSFEDGCKHIETCLSIPVESIEIQLGKGNDESVSEISTNRNIIIR